MAYRINNQLTFLHVSKAAGTSITDAIKENFNWEYSGREHDHYDDLPEEWRDHVFCVARNPYDRVVSFYHYAIKVMTKKMKKHPTSKMMSQIAILNQGFKHYVMHCQNKFFAKRPGQEDKGGVSAWTKKQQLNWHPQQGGSIQILRFENLQEDFTSLLKQHRLKNVELPTLNASKRDRDYRQYYDAETRAEVEKFYLKDIEQLGYTF